MKILLVSSFLPFPLHSGGHVRLYNVIKELAKHNEITLVCEMRQLQTESDVRELEKFCKKVIAIDRKKQWSIKNIVKSGLTISPFLITGHTNPTMRNAIWKELQENSFDLIHVETFYVMQNIPKTAIPIVLIEHNIEYLVYQKYADSAPALLRPLLLTDVIKLKVYEKKIWKKADKVVFVSENDKKISEIKEAEVVPNGVDLDQFRIMNYESRIKQKEKNLLFIGDFKWIQNRDAAKFILTDIWSEIHDSKYMLHNSFKLWIVGKNIPDEIKMLHSQNVIVDENAPEETSEIYKKSFVLLAPIRVGGGTSFKILEAMASGLAVITTELGLEGIAKESDKVCLLAQTAQEFALQIEQLVKDKKLYETITKNARKLIEEKFEWKEIVEDLEKVYKEVVC